MINKSQGDLSYSNSKYFPLCRGCALAGRFQLSYYFFEVSTSIFCVLIRLQQLLHFICFQDFSVSLGSAVLRPPIISQSPLLSSSCVQIWPLHSLRVVCFRNFSTNQHAPLQPPLLMILPCLFQSLDYFLKPLPGVISCKSTHANRSKPFVFETPLTAIVQ